MKKIILYVLSLLLYCACSDGQNRVKSSQDNTPIDTNYYLLDKIPEEKEILKSADSSIYKARKEEIVTFCISLMETLKSKELDRILDIIEFPLEVECFAHHERGKVIEKEEFLSYYDSIFGDAFFTEMEEYANSVRETSFIYDYQSGHDLRDEDFFTLGLNYIREVDGTDDEYGRIFRFEKREGKYKLILVFCAG